MSLNFGVVHVPEKKVVIKTKVEKNKQFLHLRIFFLVPEKEGVIIISTIL